MIISIHHMMTLHYQQLLKLCVVSLNCLYWLKGNETYVWWWIKENFFNIALRRYQKDEQKNQEGNARIRVHTSSNTNMLDYVIYQGKWEFWDLFLTVLVSYYSKSAIDHYRKNYNINSLNLSYFTCYIIQLFYNELF